MENACLVSTLVRFPKGLKLAKTVNKHLIKYLSKIRKLYFLYFHHIIISHFGRLIRLNY